jgi:hypothetical protein
MGHRRDIAARFIMTITRGDFVIASRISLDRRRGQIEDIG